MANYTLVELAPEVAPKLASLTGIEWDLKSAQEFAQKLKTVELLDDGGRELTDGLMTALVIRYGRPFKWSKGRIKLEDADLVSVFSPAQKEAHGRYIEMRDRFIAHPDNDFEESKPVARYWVERVLSEGIVAVDCNHRRVVGLGSNDLDWFIELTTVLLEYVQRRQVEEKARALEYVRTLPLKDVLGAEALKIAQAFHGKS